MAFTRRMLSAMGIDSEKVEEIMTAHVEVVSGLKSELDALKESTSKLESVQTELDELKNSNNNWKNKYDIEHGEFEEFKATVAAAETHKKKSDVYREVMKKSNISDKILDKLLKIAEVDKVKFDANNKVTNMDDIENDVKSMFGDFIPKSGTEYAKPDTPPDGGMGGKEKFLKLGLLEQMQYANEHPEEVKSYLA